MVLHNNVTCTCDELTKTFMVETSCCLIKFVTSFAQKSVLRKFELLTNVTASLISRLSPHTMTMNSSSLSCRGRQGEPGNEANSEPLWPKASRAYRLLMSGEALSSPTLRIC